MCHGTAKKDGITVLLLKPQEEISIGNTSAFCVTQCLAYQTQISRCIVENISQQARPRTGIIGLLVAPEVLAASLLGSLAVFIKGLWVSFKGIKPA